MTLLGAARITFKGGGLLFQHGKPGPQGQVRDKGLCLRVLRLGVMEYWSIGVLRK